MNIHNLFNHEKTVYFKKNMVEAELAFRLSDNINTKTIDPRYWWTVSRHLWNYHILQ